MVNILIADDHPLFRKGLRSSIEGNEKFKIISECSDGTDALEKCRKLKPDIAILDIEMPGMKGIEVIKALNREQIFIKSIILTNYKEAVYFEEAFNNDVSGYLLKECVEDELMKCLEQVADGDSYISPAVSSYFIKMQKTKRKPDNYPSGFEYLTQTEKKILLLISENKSNKQIADELFNSVKTIETHRYNICTKLGLKGHNALLMFSLKNKDFL